MYKLRECFHYKCKINVWGYTEILPVAFCGNSVNKFECRAFSLFETVTRGSQMKTLAILWYAQAWIIRPLQIHNNFLESLGYSKTNMASSHQVQKKPFVAIP